MWWIRTSKLSIKNSLYLKALASIASGKLTFDERVVLHRVGSYLRFEDSGITQLKAQEPSRTCTESKEEEEKCGVMVTTPDRAPPHTCHDR